MSARNRIVEAATAAGLAVEYGPGQPVSIRARTLDAPARLAIDFDTLGRATGGRRYTATTAGPLTLPAADLEARALRWIGEHAAAPAPDADDPFAGPEASAVAAGMVLGDGVTMIARDNAVVGSMVGRVGHGYTRLLGDPDPGTVELEPVGDGFHLSVWGRGTVQVVALSRVQVAEVVRVAFGQGITA